MMKEELLLPTPRRCTTPEAYALQGRGAVRAATAYCCAADGAARRGEWVVPH